MGRVAGSKRQWLLSRKDLRGLLANTRPAAKRMTSAKRHEAGDPVRRKKEVVDGRNQREGASLNQAQMGRN